MFAAIYASNLHHPGAAFAAGAVLVWVLLRPDPLVVAGPGAPTGPRPSLRTTLGVVWGLPAARLGRKGTVAAAMQPVDAPVPVSATLKAALSVLLRQDADAVPVVDGGSYLGVLTAGTVHATLRRSVGSG